MANTVLSGVCRGYVLRLGLRGDETVLDWGSGSGTYAKHLAEFLSVGGQLVCVDTSRFLAEAAKKRLRRYPNVQYLVGELPELQLRAESFDVVFIRHAYHELPKELRPAYASEFGRILKARGCLIIQEPVGEKHGIPSANLRGLFADAGLVERDRRGTEGRTYSAVYVKSTESHTTPSR